VLVVGASNTTRIPVMSCFFQPFFSVVHFELDSTLFTKIYRLQYYMEVKRVLVLFVGLLTEATHHIY